MARLVVFAGEGQFVERFARRDAAIGVVERDALVLVWLHRKAAFQAFQHVGTEGRGQILVFVDAFIVEVVLHGIIVAERAGWDVVNGTIQPGTWIHKDRALVLCEFLELSLKSLVLRLSLAPAKQQGSEA